MNSRNRANSTLKVNILDVNPEAAHALEAMRGRAQHRERQAFDRARMQRVKGEGLLAHLADLAVANF